MGVTWAATLLGESGGPSPLPCTSIIDSIAFFLSCLEVFVQLITLVILSIYHCKRHPEIWTTGVRDFQWFNGGGPANSTVLHSTPPSPTFVPKRLTLGPEVTTNAVPHLERVAANWKPAPPVTTEPIPLTYANAPVVPPTRVAMHYSASAVVSVGVMPGRRPSSKKAQTAPVSLYPTAVQTVMESTPKRSATTPAASQQQLPTDEPLPISDWPRKNPQEPYRKARSATTAAAIPTGVPGPEPTSSPESTPRNRSPRRRPPPLDLSAAQPNKLT